MTEKTRHYREDNVNREDPITQGREADKIDIKEAEVEAGRCDAGCRQHTKARERGDARELSGNSMNGWI